MIKQNNSCLGIIFPNTYDALLPELTNIRMMASVPFASRYRLIDFVLSSMTNSGIDNISVVPTRNYHSLMDHLGSGREWDLVRKNGGLNIFPPYSEKNSKVANGRIGMIFSLLDFFRSQKEKYVVLADSNIAVNFDFKNMLKTHIESGADVTVAYTEQDLPESIINTDSNDKGFFYTLNMDPDGRVRKIYVNEHSAGKKNFSMNFYIMERELFVKLFNEAFVLGDEYFERDVLLGNIDTLNIKGYKFDGYYARISSLKSYFDETMKLLDDDNLNALFKGGSIYTKVRDDNPTRYIAGSSVKNIMAADGCVIAGNVENSVLFRGVKVGKGAVVKNCVLMQDTVVEDGAVIENIVTDKAVTISASKTLTGSDSFPVYISKGKTV